MFYSPSARHFYDPAIHGARLIERITLDPPTGDVLSRWTEPNPDCKMPADVVELTADERAALLAGEAAGKLIVPNEAGFPVLQDPPAQTHAQLIERALTMTRVERQPIISVLDGLQASSLANGDSASATHIETVKQGLRDITKVDLSGCASFDDMRGAVMSAYANLVGSNPSVALAFKGVLS